MLQHSCLKIHFICFIKKICISIWKKSNTLPFKDIATILTEQLHGKKTKQACNVCTKHLKIKYRYQVFYGILWFVPQRKVQIQNLINLLNFTTCVNIDKTFGFLNTSCHQYALLLLLHFHKQPPGIFLTIYPYKNRKALQITCGLTEINNQTKEKNRKHTHDHAPLY